VEKNTHLWATAPSCTVSPVENQNWSKITSKLMLLNFK
jgi:hypothetical protein